MTPKDVKWLCEETAFDEKLDDLFCALKNQGNEYKIIKYLPFESGQYNQFADEDCVMFYGSLNMMKQIFRQKKWIPCGYCNLKNFECASYYTHLGEYLLNSEYMMMPLSEILRNKEFIYKTFGIDNAVFVRPSNGDKPFAGKIMYKEDVSAEELGYGFYHEDMSLLVVVSSPKKIKREWRLVVTKNDIITGSQYKDTYNGELEVSIDASLPDEVAEFAKSVAAVWQPDPIFTLDVCESNGELKLLEINSLSCSGLYACDKKKIVKAASEIAAKEWENYNEGV